MSDEALSTVIGVAEGLAELRGGAGMADRSTAGRLWITGADALDLLNRLTTNKLDELPPGQGRVTVVTSGDARVIDLLALGTLDGGMWCLTSPGHASEVVEWLDTYTFGEEILVEDRTDAAFQLTLAGPAAAKALADVGSPAGALGLDELTVARIAGIEVVVWHLRAGGADGYELIGDATGLDAVRMALADAGAVPVSPEAWELFRIVNGMPAADAEFGLFTNPLESGLVGAISEDKGCYTGQEVIARLQTYKKVQRQLMSVALSGPAKPGAKLQADGASAGQLTSVAEGPDGYVGLALVPTKVAAPGLVVDVADVGVQATLVDSAYALATAPAEA